MLFTRWAEHDWENYGWNSKKVLLTRNQVYWLPVSIFLVANVVVVVVAFFFLVRFEILFIRSHWFAHSSIQQKKKRNQVGKKLNAILKRQILVGDKCDRVYTMWKWKDNRRGVRPRIFIVFHFDIILFLFSIVGIKRTLDEGYCLGTINRRPHHHRYQQYNATTTRAKWWF